MDVSALRLSLGKVDWTRCQGIHMYWVCIPNWNILQGCFWLCDWLSLWCLVPWTNYCPLCFGQFFGKYILYKLVCNVDRMEDCFSSLCKYILLVIIDMYCYKSSLLCFVLILYLFLCNSVILCRSHNFWQYLAVAADPGWSCTTNGFSCATTWWELSTSCTCIKMTS